MKSPKTDIYGLSFNYSINNSKSIGNHNAIFKVEFTTTKKYQVKHQLIN